MKQITANLYCEDRFSMPPNFLGCNTSFITTSDGIVMIDTPYMPTKAIEWRNRIDKMGKLRYIINTDHHPDHTTGNSFFSGTVVSHEKHRELFTVDSMVPLDTALAEGLIKPDQFTLHHILSDVKKYDPEGIALMDGYRSRPPSITFSERLNIHLGEYNFNLLYLPGHTQAHIGVYIPQEKVFFSGDNFTNKTQPSLSQSMPLQWVQSLKQIEELDIDIIIPGHGEVCKKDELVKFRLFIEECIQLVRQAIKQGMSKEEAAGKISFEYLYPGDRSNKAVHPGADMQRKNVIRLYEMLSG
jgi:cyclase